MKTSGDKKKAPINGITGQEWVCLAELLLEKGYVVHPIKHGSSSFNTERVGHLYQNPMKWTIVILGTLRILPLF